MAVRAGWLLPGGPGNPGQTREDTRVVPVGTFTPAGELATRPGVLPGGAPFAAVGTAAMDLQISVGRAVVQGTTAQGPYPVALDAPETLTFADGDAQYDRIDTVVVRVYDGLYDTSGLTQSTVEIVKGAAAAVPSAPPMPSASCLPLWDVTVPAGASAGVGGIDWGTALSDRRSYTVSHGGIGPVSLSDVGAYDGQYADVDGTLYRWDAAAAAWDIYRPPAVPAVWQEWEPTWGTDNPMTQPSLGDGEFDCWYTEIDTTTFFTFRLTIGSTTVFESGDNGNWVFGLPVSAARSVGTPVGKVTYFAGASYATAGLARLHDANAMWMYVDSGSPDGAAVASGIADKAAPSAWGPGNELLAFGQYEAA